MKYDPEIHHRHSIRLKGYDYSQSGAYFVTIVAQGRISLFGHIENGGMILNDAGRMIVKWWNELPNKFPQITLGAFVIMPNHFHGIIIVDTDIGEPVGGDLRVSPGGADETNTGGHAGPPQPIPPQPRPNAPLSQMIQWFKTMTTNEYIRGIKELGWTRFDGKLWQRDYYEHIIRNTDEANRIHLYIESNPANWADDEENPSKSTLTSGNKMASLILPEKITIQLTNLQGQSLEIPDVVFYVHFFARHKNDFHLGPYVSDKSGRVAISHQELIWNIQATYDSGLMDYSAVETSHPFIEIILEHPDRIKRALETREKVWKMLLKGEQEIWGCMENLLNAYRNASNEQLELSKDSNKISDVWDGAKNEYEYKFPISIKT